jgi:ABC-type Fe3+-hydroxamate transport system substrate-binding protein
MPGTSSSGPAATASFFDGTDALGRPVRLSASPQRIVSLVPSITELLYELDLGDRVAGLTRFCERPEHWREAKTIVGGTKTVDADRVAELDADLVIANREENEKADVQALSEQAPVYVTDVKTVPGAVAMIRAVGRLTDRADRAAEIARAIQGRFDALPSPAPIPTAYLIWRDPYMAAGGDTFIHDVMQRGGFENVFAESDRYPEVTVDDLAASGAQLVLCSSEPFPFHQKERFTADLRASLDAHVEIADGQLFSWYGSRLLDTPQYLGSLRERVEG